MAAFSVSSMLNNNNEHERQQQTTTRPARPAVLDISNLLCSSNDEASLPSLSPSLTPSPTTTPAYPFPPITLPPIDELNKQIDRDVMIWTPTNEIGNPMTSSLSLSSTCTATTSSTTTSSNSSAATTATCAKEEPIFSCTNSSSTSTCSSSASGSNMDSSATQQAPPPLKAKRKRANAKQLEVLNRVFDRTFFPSTQLRAELGRQLGMSPRTVQIWFQNRRQAIRTRERQRLLRIRDNNDNNNATEK
ncbi:hypothetical protein VTP01DRAFT_4895 [Rhizomucor pusillus]|uniref:uncharacterized protein n=1 Tax=Rhizomucor pusillus TaxID=4840 RepID=UPI003743BC80